MSTQKNAHQEPIIYRQVSHILKWLLQWQKQVETNKIRDKWGWEEKQQKPRVEKVQAIERWCPKQGANLVSFSHAGLSRLVHRIFVSGKLFFKAAIKLTVPLEWVYFFLNCPLLQPKNKTFQVRTNRRKEKKKLGF